VNFQRAASNAGLSAKPGKGAIKARYRSLVEGKGTSTITHSIDLDGAFEEQESHANRWDYGMGMVQKRTHMAVWIELHSATSTGEVERVLQKLGWLRAKLADWHDLSALAQNEQKRGIQQFWWLVPRNGKMCFRSGSREAKQLAQSGMGMPVRKITLA